MIQQQQQPKNATITQNTTHTATFEIYEKGFQPGQSNVNFFATIPNYIGYPEHQRCLVQVLNISTVPTATGQQNFTRNGQTRPLVVGVELVVSPRESACWTTVFR